MKILLFGHSGQVGSAIQQSARAEHKLILADIDMTDEHALRECILSHHPDMIINAAAYTNVDGAEDNAEIAFQTNAVAPRIMATIAKEKNIRLIHYSTDYVFNGEGTTAWTENDTPAPLNIYGQSKLDGERHIIASGCAYLIFRTSWVYDSAHDNFVTKILSLSRQKDSINVISDQIGAPTSARFIAEATYHAITKPERNGIYHLCCAGETSWYDYARLVIETDQPSSPCQVRPILSKDYPQKARRPLNSRLKCQRFIADFGLIPPDWKAECLETLHKIRLRVT